MKRLFNAVYILAISLLLVACAGTPTRGTLAEDISPENGLVVLKVVSLQPVGFLNKKWKILNIERSDGAIETLSDTSVGTAQYSLFVGTVPPGRYTIKGLNAPGVQNLGLLPYLLTSDSSGSASSIGTFSVAKGKTTNLGIVVSSQVGDSVKMVALADDDAKRTVMMDIDPRYVDRVKSWPEINGWSQAPSDEVRVVATNLVRQTATAVSELRKASSGQVTFGSALGLVHSRLPDGRWVSQRMAGLDMVTCTQGLDGGQVFAGTDTGRYYIWSPVSQAARQFSLGTPAASIDHILPVGSFGYVLGVSLPTGRYQGNFPILKWSFILKSRLDQQGGERELITFDDASAVGQFPIFFDGRNLQIFHNHIGFSRTADLHVIDLQTFSRRKDEVPFWVRSIRPLSDSVVWMNRINGLSDYSSLSFDNARTWHHNEKPGPSFMSFLSADIGYGAIGAGMGWSTSKVNLSKTLDGGATWATEPTPIEVKMAVQILPISERELVVFTGLGIQSSRDNGRTWQQEWPAQ